MSGLALCPFCGGHASQDPDAPFIICDDCFGSAPRAQWNRRPTSVILPALKEAWALGFTAPADIDNYHAPGWQQRNCEDVFSKYFGAEARAALGDWKE